MVRQAIAADASLAEALDPLLEARGHLYRAFLDIDRRVKVVAQADLPVADVGTGRRLNRRADLQGGNR